MTNSTAYFLRKRALSVIGISLSALLTACVAPPKNTMSDQTLRLVDSENKKPRYILSNEKYVGDPNILYLFKEGEDWKLTLNKIDLSNKDTERLTYWPSAGLVNFDFDSAAPKSLDSMFLCDEKSRQRNQRSGYTPCNSNFIVKDGISLGRVLAGVASAGVTEVSLIVHGIAPFKIDKDALIKALTEQPLALKINEFNYRNQYKQLSGRKSLVSFIQDNASTPDQSLVVEARRRLAELDEDARVLSMAKSALGSKSSYEKKFTPRDPKKYCASFERDQEAFSYCRSNVGKVVQGLANRRAHDNYYADLCLEVVKISRLPLAKEVCTRPFKTDTCEGSSSESKLCRILSPKA